MAGYLVILHRNNDLGMKKLFVVLFGFVLTLSVHSRKDSLFVYYIDNYPYSYVKNDSVKGIEVEIIKEYIEWCRTDGLDLIVTYKMFPDFDQMFNAVSTGGPKVIGLGSVSITEERLKLVSFSPPYLKNVAVMVSNIKTPNLESKSDLKKHLKDAKAITIKSSTYEDYLLKVKKQFLKNLEFTYADSEYDMLSEVSKNANLFAYCDILSYSSYVEKTHTHSIKIQRNFNDDSMHLGLIIPKKSKYSNTITEFFESGFGFISTKRYKEILNNYLSFEVNELVKMH